MSAKAEGIITAVVAIMVAAWVASVATAVAESNIAESCETFRGFVHDGKRYTCEEVVE